MPLMLSVGGGTSPFGSNHVAEDGGQTLQRLQRRSESTLTNHLVEREQTLTNNCRLRKFFFQLRLSILVAFKQPTPVLLCQLYLEIQTLQMVTIVISRVTVSGSMTVTWQGSSKGPPPALLKP